MKNIKSAILSGITVSLFFWFAQQSVAHENSSLSHSGGTDECGCHTNSKTGEYHCHTRKKRGGSCPASFKKEQEEKNKNSTINTFKNETV